MAKEKNKVEIIESCMVVPDKETPKHRLWLSNLDLYNHSDHAPIFYLYKPHGNSNDFFSVDTLKKAMGKALVTFYPLAGRLVFDEKGRPEVDCNAEGALFSVARAHCTVEGFGGFHPSATDIEVERINRDVVPLNDANDDGEEGIKDGEDPPILAFGAVELSSIFTAESKLSPGLGIKCFKYEDIKCC
ncbi:hypothetical protein J5N97_026966 [Dioscorea zingiberensis]|uniref:Shikimate O-hydroxycinnamoyltransferase n=1 Tax=Dioscorea zingiberensis TaxID=325984 RepID=A0A9D5C3Z2_9LILI|nr:hypothetical protein J5N97_026966 [Dioscorea zingiberensis]